MHHTTPSIPPTGVPPRSPVRAGTLAVLVLGVLLAHAALLYGAPLARISDASAATPPAPTFSTRTIAAVPPQQDAPAAPKARPPTRVPLQRATPTAVADATVSDAITQQAPVNRGFLATESVAHPAPTDAAPTQLALASTTAAPESAPPAATAPARRFVYAAPTRLKYDIKGEVKGFPYFVRGDLLWHQDGKTYDTRLEVSHFILGSRVQTSRGELTAQGLAPTRFGDKVRSEVAAHFERSKGKISFSANTPDVPLQAGAQDQLSVFFQLGAMVAGAPEQFAPGTRLIFQAVGAKYSEQWLFVAGASETLTLPGGTVKAIKFVREASDEYDSRGEIWLAAELGYLPVRIRLTQANGDFVDQMWKSTETPSP